MDLSAWKANTAKSASEVATWQMRLARRMPNITYTRSGKKPASVPLPRKIRLFGLCAGNGYAASEV
jgi:hypothetical protein